MKPEIHKTEQAKVAVNLQTCIREVPFRISEGTPPILLRILMVFLILSRQLPGQ
jgi:hypothetical protein